MVQGQVLSQQVSARPVGTELAVLLNLIFAVLFAVAAALALVGYVTLSLACGVLALLLAGVYLVRWGALLEGPPGRLPLLGLLLPVAALLVFGLIFLSAVLLLPSAVSTGPLTTALSSSATTPGLNLGGEVRFDPSGLPTCAPQQLPLGGVVLALDMSGSMQGTAEQATLTAARSFVNTVDLTNTQVALIAFTGQAQLVQPLTHDKAPLIAGLGTLHAGGETSINAALLAAQTELATTAAVPNTVRAIVLLTDGDDPDPQTVMQTAATIKAQGTRIITIGLANSGLNQTLLRDIASAPEDFHRSPATQELSNIYEGIALNLSQTRATNLQLTLPYDKARFVLPLDSISPDGAVSSSTVQWQVAAIGPATQTFHFTVAARDLGLQPLNGALPQLQLVDCSGATQQFNAPQGPTVLSIIPLAWLWLPLLLAGVVNLFWQRHSDPTPAAGHVSSDYVLAQRSLVDYSWLVSALSEEQYPSAGNARPVVLLGLGAFGRATLEQVKQTLVSKYGRLPANVHLLYVDVQPDVAGGAAGSSAVPRPTTTKAALKQPSVLADDEIVLLEPDLQQLDAAREREKSKDMWEYDRSYLRWWHTEARQVGRALGRLGILHDMMSRSGSNLLIARLKKICPAQSRFILLAALEDGKSSGLLDVAVLVRYAIEEEAQREVRVVEALLTMPRAERYTSGNTSDAAAFAAALELERFAYNRPYDFNYGTSSIARDTAPIDYHYLLDTVGSATMGTATWQAAAELVTLIADSDLDQQQKQQQANINRHIGTMRQNGQLAVSALSVFVARLPIPELRRVSEVQLLQQALFSADDALYAAEDTPLDGPSLLPPAGWRIKTERRQVVYAFLRGRHPHGELENRHQFFAILADADERGWDADTEARLNRVGRLTGPAQQNLIAAFGWSLEEQAFHLLNLPAGEAAGPHSRGLGAWTAFLDELRVVLSNLRTQMADTVRTGDRTQGMTTVLDGTKTLVEGSREEGLAWQKALLGTGEFSYSLADEEEADGPTLRATLQTALEQRQATLKALQQMPHQAVLPLPLDEATIYQEQVWQPFHAALMERVGWHSSLAADRIALQLVIMAPTPLTDATTALEQRYSLGAVADGTALAALLRLARAFSKTLNSYQVPLDLPAVQSHLVREAQPDQHLKFDATAAKEIQQIDAASYLIVPTGARAHTGASDLAAAIATVRGLELPAPPAVITGSNTHHWAFVRETELIALTTVRAYQQLHERFDGAVDDDSYVFAAGQTANEQQQILAGLPRSPIPAGPFHPRFVELLEYRLRAITFARAYLHGLLQEAEDRSGFVLAPLNIPLPGGSLLEAMQHFCIDGPHAVKSGSINDPLGERNMAATLEGIEAAISRGPSDAEAGAGVLETQRAALQALLARRAVPPLANMSAALTLRLTHDMARFILAVAAKSQDYTGYDHLGRKPR